MMRLGRWYTGTAVGLVLSGGGARGGAHLGALRALEEAGIPVDCVGGTSIGALVAASYAKRPNSLVARRLAWRCVRVMNSITTFISDLTLPLVSYLSGASFNRYYTLYYHYCHWCLTSVAPPSIGP
jgi:lysophospholipid hydrolase